MTTITARVPQMDWSKGFERHWNGGNAAVTHPFNALSFLFPQAERFFIDVAREVASKIDLCLAELAQWIGQANNIDKIG